MEYRPVVPSLVRAEVQRLDSAHEVLRYGPHAHDFYEVVVFDRGGGVHVVEGQEVPVVAGQAWLLRPQTTHDLVGLGDAEGWLLLAGAEALGVPVIPTTGAPWPDQVLLRGFGLDPAGLPLPLPLGPSGLRRWTGWLAALQAELAEGALGYQHAVRALLHQLLVDAARRCSTPVMPAAQALVTEALTVVEERFRSRLALSDVARALAVTPGHLTEVVRRQTGRPLGAWILERRLSEARLLLTDSDDPLATIAAGAGFNDLGQFTRAFRRRHGRPPGAWRHAVRTSGSAAATRPC